MTPKVPWAALAWAALRWLLFAAPLFVLSLAVCLAAPLLALAAVTGADGRRYLPWPLYWLQTHDAPLDELWVQGGYDDALPAGWCQRARDGSAVMRWLAEALWLVRNTAYGVAHYACGWHSAGQQPLWHSVTGEWDSGADTAELLVLHNARGQVAWLWRGQWFWRPTRYVRWQLGWKLTRTDPDGLRMLAIHFNPVRPHSPTNPA